MLETGGGVKSRERETTSGGTSRLHRTGRGLLPWAFLIFLGCGTAQETPFLAVSPSPVTLRLGENQPFSATLGSGGSVAVAWAVNGAVWGDATHGTITREGVFTAPTAVDETDLLTIPDLVQVQATADGVEGGSASVHLTTFHPNHILFRESGGAPASFHADTRSGGQRNIAAFGSRVYGVWSDNRAGDPDIYLQSSADGGGTFGTPVRVNSETSGEQRHPAVAVHPTTGEIYVVWEDAASGDADIYFSRSGDGGGTFSPRQRVNNDAGATDQTMPTVAVTPDGILYVAWEDNRNPALTSPTENTDIYLAVSPDGGATFPNLRITGGEVNAPQTRQLSPALVSDPQGRIYLVWEDRTNWFASLYLSRITRDGSGTVTVVSAVLAASQADASLPANTGQFHPALTATPDGGIYLVWESAKIQNGVPTAYDIYLTGTTDGGLTFHPPVRVNRPGTGGLYGGWAYPAIASDGSGTLYLAWEDSRNGLGDQDIYAAQSLSSTPFEFKTARKVNDDHGAWQEKPGIITLAGRSLVVWSDFRNNASPSCTRQTCPNDVYFAME